jgi:tape measure domain-containing protein
MATTSRRDVKLVVTTETEGEGKLKGLASDLRDIAAAGGEAGPKFEALAAELDRAAAATKAAREAERATTNERTASRAALDQQRDALARMRAESTAATRSTEEHQQRERALKLALIEARAAVRDKATAQAAAAAESRAAVAAEKALADQARATAAAFRASSTETVAGTAAVSRGFETLQAQLAAVRNIAAVALGGSLTGSLLKSVSDTADAVTNLQARIKLVTGEGDAFATAWRGVQQVAQTTNSTLESTGTLFARIAQAGKEIGVSQREALALTETINQAVQLSGSSAQASDAAVQQLLQSLSSGVLRGEEYNSISEQSARLQQALAAGIGVTTGELRKLAEAGSLTSSVVIGALRGQSQVIRDEYATLPPTVGRAITQLSTAWSLYVNEASAATGASTTAAGAISALARNLDSVAGVLISVGKAAAGYAALNLARSFLDTAAAAAASTAAKTAETAATVASTTATAANTAARVANSAATVAAGEAAVASAGKFAALLSTLKTFSLIAVITNFREIGTAIGEGTAKLFGYGKASEELERRLKAEEEATRRNADAKAALAQQTALAADKALGLSVEARKIVGDFDQVVTKGDGAAQALEKVTKALQLGDAKGIRDAGAALDALAVRGKLAGDQIASTLAAALKTEDLARFEVTARAAFDTSEQGARRLKAALDAVALESLRRAGTSVDELRTGFNATATSALNDLDLLKRSLDDLGARGEVAGRALSAAITKALDAATTTRSVQEVISRIEELGRTGRLTGDALAAALDKARSKADSLRDGVNSVDEAFRVLGLRAPAELARVAAASKEAFDRIRADGTSTLADKQRAFEAYAKTVTALAGSEAAALLQVQAEALGLTTAVDNMGKVTVRAMGEAGGAVEGLRGRMRALRDEADQTAGSLSSVYEAQTKSRSDRIDADQAKSANKYDSQNWALDASGQRTTSGSYLPEPSTDGPWSWVPALNQGYTFGGYWTNAAGAKYTGMTTGPFGQDRSNFLGEPMANLGESLRAPQPSFAPYRPGGLATGPAGAPGASASPSGPAPSYVTNITLGGRRTTIATATAADQSALAALLQELETAADRGG